MNKKIAILGFSAIACLLSMSSCTSVGEHKSSAELYYTNSTHADTEAFHFLRETYKLASDEVAFAAIVSQRATNAQVKSLATDLGTHYQEILSKIEELATKSDVLVPYAAMPAFALPAGLDSASASVLERAFLEHALHNQEAIVHQFEGATRNTKVALNHYAREVLPKLEEHVEETKGLL